MKDKRINIVVFLAILLIGVIVLAACSGSTSEPSESTSSDQVAEEEHDEGETSDDDHGHVEVPAEFEDFVNPLDGDIEASAAGKALYAITCAACHGPTGLGDGGAAAALDPKPSTLADADMIAGLSDAYLYWRISEGGAMEPFNSSMPPWRASYSEDQIWQLVTYIRSLSE